MPKLPKVNYKLPRYKIQTKFKVQAKKLKKIWQFVFKKLRFVCNLVLVPWNLMGRWYLYLVSSKVYKKTKPLHPKRSTFAWALLANMLFYLYAPFINPTLEFLAKTSLFKTVAQYTAIKESKSDTYKWEATNTDLQAYFGDKNFPDNQRFAIKKNGSLFDLRETKDADSCPINAQDCIPPLDTSNPETQNTIVDVHSLSATGKYRDLKKDIESVLGAKTSQGESQNTVAENTIYKSSLTPRGITRDNDLVSFSESRLVNGDFIDKELNYEIVDGGVKQTIYLPNSSQTPRDGNLKFQFLLTLDNFRVIKATQDTYLLISREQDSVIQINKPIVKVSSASVVEKIKAQDSNSLPPQTKVTIYQEPRGIILEISMDVIGHPELVSGSQSLSIETLFSIGSNKDPLVRAASKLVDNAHAAEINTLPILPGVHADYLYEHNNNNFQVGFGSRKDKNLGRSKMALSKDGLGLEMQLVDESKNSQVQKATQLKNQADLVKDVAILSPNTIPGLPTSPNSPSSTSLVDAIQTKDVKSGVDIEYKVFPSGVKEDIILNNPPLSTSSDLSTYSYALNTYGLSPKKDADGLWSFYATNSHPGEASTSIGSRDSIASLQNDHPVFTIPAPFAQDANGSRGEATLDISPWTDCGKYLKVQTPPIDPSLRDHANGEAISTAKSLVQNGKNKAKTLIKSGDKVSLNSSNDSHPGVEPNSTIGSQKDSIASLQNDKPQVSCYKVTISVDKNWLIADDRAYPVLIDPSFSHTASSDFNITNNDTQSSSKNRVQDTSSPQLETYYKELPADINTVGHWHMNEGTSTTASDSSGNSNTLTFGASTQAPTWANSASSRLGAAAVSFDGSNDYMAATGGSSSSLNIRGPLTIESWIYLNSVSPAANKIIVWGGTSGGTSNSSPYYLSFDTTNKITMAVSNGSSTETVSSATTLSASTWYHVAGIARGNQLEVYINGKLDNNGTQTLTPAALSNNIQVGGLSGTSSNTVNGIIDELRISNIARAPEEVRMDALRSPYSVFTSKVVDLTTSISTLNSLTWTETGVGTGDGETLSSAASLVSQWNFNNTSSTTTATSDAGSCGSTCNLTATNMTTTGQDAAAVTGWTANNRRWGAGALMFDGSNDSASCTDANCGGTSKLDIGNLTTQDWTIETWIRTSASTNQSYDIVSKGLQSYTLSIWSGKPIFGFVDNFQIYYYANSVTRINDGQWHYVVGTWNSASTTASIYVDGKLEGSTVITTGTLGFSSSDTTSDFVIAGPGGIGINVPGVIDSTRIYRRLLGANEITTNYNVTNLEVQTRTGSTTTPNDGTWEAWKPATGETQIDSFDSSYQYNTSDSGLVSYWPMDETSSYPYARTTDVKATTSYANFAVDTGGYLPQGLAGYWNLNETSGARSDSVFGSTLTDNNTVTSNTGKLGNAAEFTAANSESLSTSNNIATGIESNTSFTASAWVYLTSKGADRTIISNSDNGAFTGSYRLYYKNSSDRFVFYLLDNTAISYELAASTFGSPSLNTWYHIVFWFNNTNKSMNIEVNNGTIDSFSNGSPAQTGSPIFRIGANTTSGSASDFWNGRIDEVGIWKRLLNAQEITNLYNSGNGDTLTAASGNHGYLSGTNIVDGKFGKAKGFNGSSDVISIGNPANLQLTTAVTVEAWVKPVGGTGVQASIAGRWLANAGSNCAYLLYVTSGNNFAFASCNSTTVTNATSSTTYSVGSWYHIVGVFDGSQSKTYLYVNGQQSAVSNSSATINNPSAVNFKIGTDDGPNGYFNGVIDETRVYNTVIAASTIQQHYLEGINGINGVNNVSASTDTTNKYEGAGSQRLGIGAPKVDSKTVALWHLDETTSAGPIVDSTSIRKFHSDTTGNLTNGLVSYWKFEDYGTPQNDSVSKNNLTLSNAPTAAVGKLGYAMSFNGTSNYLSVADNQSLKFGSGSFTLAAWVKTSSASTSNIFRKDSGGGALYGLRDNGGVLQFLYANSARTVVSLSGATNIANGNWHFVVGVRDTVNNQVRVYVDGNSDATAITDTLSGQSTDTTSQLEIGRANNGGAGAEWFNGTIDEPAIWNRALTASEISNLYNSGNANPYLGTSGNNGSPTSTSVVDGFYGKARSFNGSTDYILANNGTSVTGNYTLSAWVNPTSVAAGFAVIVGYGNGSCSTRFGLWRNGSSIYAFHSDGVSTPTVTAGTLVTNQWQYVTSVYNGSSLTVYLNGQAVGSPTSTSTNPTFSSSIYSIGACDNGTSKFTGVIDEVKVDSVARSYDEIQEAYRAGRDQRIGRNLSSTNLSSALNTQYAIAADRPGTYMEATIGESAFANYEPDTNTVGLWHLEEANGTGAYIKDSSGRGLNGTPNGTTSSVQGKLGRGRLIGSTVSTDYISTSSPGSLTNFTMDIWIKPNTLTNNFFMGGINGMCRVSSGVLDCAVFDNRTGAAGNNHYNTAGTIVAGQWQHIALVAQGTSVLKTYINGQLVSNSNLTSTYSGTYTTFMLGGGGATTVAGFDGIIDEARLSDTARTDDEIRQAFEVGKRTHPITVDFVSSPQATYTSGTSMTINVMSGQDKLSDSLKPGDQIMVKENIGGVEYIGNGTVSKIDDTSTRSYGTVTLVSALSSIPPSGFTTAAKVLKWQREYMDLSGSLGTQRDAITRLTIRITDGSQGSNVWLDDMRYTTGYLSNPAGSSPTSTAQRYYQYRVIQTSADPGVSSNFTAVTQNYTTGPTMAQIMRNGAWFSGGVSQPFWWAR